MSEPDTILYQLSPDEVVIPRAQYEAYRAAAKALTLARAWNGFATPNRVLGIIDQALAALRSAGIHETEGGEK